MNLQTNLFEHQRPAVEKLKASRVGGLFMEMGTGKSRAAIELVHLRRQRIDKVIWFCPVSLKETIRYEIGKHTDCRDVCVFDDNTRQRTLPQARWYIVGIESMSSSDRTVLAVNRLMTSRTFVIVDESSYIKGHNSRRTRRITRISQKARYRLILTGTPMSQGVVDLYAQMYFLSPKILGYSSFYSFAANHLEYSEKYPGMIVRAHHTGWLAAKIQPYIYQVTKEEAGLRLPPKLYEGRYFLMTSEQAEWYYQAKVELLLDLPDEEIDSIAIFRLFTALQQIVSGFWNRGGELITFPHHRLEQLLTVVAGLDETEKVVIWCKYRTSIEQIAAALRVEYGAEAVALFYGDLSERERNAEIERFRGGPARFLLATQASGGHGLDLTVARYVIFYENEFKYANRIQAEDRCHRIGQERRVTYIDIGCVGSIDDRIAKALATKGDAVRAFREQVEKVKRADRAELKRLVMDL